MASVDQVNEDSMEDQIGLGKEKAKQEKELRKEGLKSIVKNESGAFNKMFLTIGIVVVVIVVGFFSLAGKAKQQPGAADLDTVPKVKATAGPNAQVNENYLKLQETENQQAAQNAAVTGESHIDTILPGSTTPVEKDNGQVKDWTVALPPPPQPVQQVAMQGPNQAYERQIGMLLDNWQPGSASSYNFSRTSQQVQQAPQAQQQVSAASKDDEASGPVKTLKTGDRTYAILSIGANSDEPGPVMAEIVHGDLATAKVVGEFKLVNKKLMLTFKQLSLPWSDKSVTINAVAVDPDTGGQAMAVEVDNHYFERVALPFIAKFVQGYGEAVARAGTTVTTSALGSVTAVNGQLDGKRELAAAVGSGASAFGNVIETGVNRKPTVIIPAGTPVGILFTQDAKVPVNPNAAL